MAVGATMTLPLIDDGKLWGLIACYHATPRLIDTDAPLGARMVAQLASAQLNLKESLEDMRYGAQLRRIHNRLLQRMEEEENLVHGLVKHSPNMLDLADASGAAAAIYYSNEWTIIGVPPQ